MPVRRPATVLAVVALLAAGLTGCSTAVNVPFDDAGCGAYSSGNASEAITARGGSATAAPTVDFPTPLKSGRVQVSELRAGHGDRVNGNDAATVGITLLNGRTGESLESVGYDSAFAQVAGRESGGLAVVSRALACRAEGSRFALVGPADRILSAAAIQQSGLPGDLPLVFVVDVKKRFLGKADGQNQLQDNALPQVVTAVDGQPGIVLPNVNSAPRSFRSAVVKAGDGATVRRGDRVLVQFSEWNWAETATPQDTTSTWNRNSAPFVIRAGSQTSFANVDLPFASRLTDQRVGSQLLFSYPGAQGTAAVWVVDVLGVV